MFSRTDVPIHYVGSVSEFFWGAEIRVDVSGICVATLVSPELKNNIANCISRYLPEHDDLTIQHYVWMRGAAISRHDDYHVKFGATIYLNKDWNIDYGGIFLWKDQASHNIKNLLSPNFNTLGSQRRKGSSHGYANQHVGAGTSIDSANLGTLKPLRTCLIYR